MRFAKPSLARLVAGLALSVGLLAAGPDRAAPSRPDGPPQIWFSAVSDIPAPAGFVVDQDYPQLFEPGAPWPRARARVQVFQMTQRYVVTQPEEKLQKMFAFLREHHIALSVTFGMIPDNNCGAGVEGMVHQPNANLRAAERVKKLGGDLQYINVDEPLFFGHYFVSQGQKVGCRYPLDALAQGYAGEIRKVRTVFPDAEVVETEPTEGLESPPEFGRWIDLLQQGLGPGAPKVYQFDVQWNSRKRPWRQAAPDLIGVLRNHGLGYGVIFNGTGQDQTDQAWIETAQGNIRAWEAAIPVAPANVMIQSWNRHPQTVLPETAPTLPYLVNWYCDNARSARGCR